MPYVTISHNRYIHEHDCKNYHYGDQTMVRPCCVEDAKLMRKYTLENALTTEHPAYKSFCDAWNALTDAEQLLVGDIIQNRGIAEGFSPHPGRQLELELD